MVQSHCVLVEALAGQDRVFEEADREPARMITLQRLNSGVSRVAIKRNPKKRVLSADELLRVSYLIGIFKALNILYSDRLADSWIQRPNSNPIFTGATPLAYIRKGGLPALQTVRRLLDARRGG